MKSLHWVPEATGASLPPEITLACDFDFRVEEKAVAVDFGSPELRTCALAARPRYGNYQGALC